MKYLVIKCMADDLEKILNKNTDKNLYGIFPENVFDSTMFNLVFII